jgi:hypothetical protein
VRVSTHEITMSALPWVFPVTYSVDACHLSPQNKLSRLTSTTDLYRPISDSENGLPHTGRRRDLICVGDDDFKTRMPGHYGGLVQER